MRAGALLSMLALWLSACQTPMYTPPRDAAKPACYASLSSLPPAWRPAPKLEGTLEERPWTAAEQAHVERALQVGVDEMVAYFEARPEQVNSLWDNAVEAFIDMAYGGDNHPRIRDISLQVASTHLLSLAAPYVGEAPPQGCVESDTLLTLVVYARELHQRAPSTPRLESTLRALETRTNVALRDCGSLDTLFGYDPLARLKTPHLPNGQMYDLVMWSITLGDALANPALELPDGADQVIGATWRYLEHYALPDAKLYREGANHSDVYDAAYLVTHAGYIPTGYGRHALYRADGEWLFRFLRANFYPVMEMGELDLLAEFVDLFRQYGCTEETDRQLRDGTRYLLSLYEKAGGSWMAHREPYETKDISPYDLIHKPWTAIAGLRRRTVEQIVPGTYGASVRGAIDRYNP